MLKTDGLTDVSIYTFFDDIEVAHEIINTDAEIKHRLTLCKGQNVIEGEWVPYEQFAVLDYGTRRFIGCQDNWIGSLFPDYVFEVRKGGATCKCKFVDVGVALDNTNCKVHTAKIYKCCENNCSCLNYRPNKRKLRHNHWPLCCCGHIAQMHN